MRRYSSNLAFVDLLFNLLVGFTSLFVIAFLLINPIAKSGVVDPPIRFMIEMSWDDTSHNDIDLYVKGPDGKTIFYSHKANGYITLKRDDIGAQSDTFILNGKTIFVSRNYEITTMTALPDGDYVVNVHFYSKKDAVFDQQEVNVRITNLQPYLVVFEGSTKLKQSQERTLLAFRVKDGQIVDKRTDVQVQLRRIGARTP
jgi:uncharacterized protein YfaP (DUF2135 family)